MEVRLLICYLGARYAWEVGMLREGDAAFVSEVSGRRPYVYKQGAHVHVWSEVSGLC